MSSTGQIIGTVVGGIVGMVFPVVGFALGASIGGALGGMIDPPKGPTVTGPRLDDLSFQSSAYGTDIYRAYGTVPVVGNVIWLEGDRYREFESTSDSGGKGGGSKQSAKTFTYYATFAVHLIRVPSAAQRVLLNRMWIGTQLVLDEGGESTVSYTFYDGSDPQSPDPRMQADKGAANVSGYPGDCYIVINDLDLTPYSNTLQMAQVKCELIITESISEVDVKTEFLLSSGLGVTPSNYPCCTVFRPDKSTLFTKQESLTATKYTASFWRHSADGLSQIGVNEIEKNPEETQIRVVNFITSQAVESLMACIILDSFSFYPRAVWRVVVKSSSETLFDGKFIYNNSLQISERWLLYENGFVYVNGWFDSPGGIGGRVLKLSGATSDGGWGTYVATEHISLTVFSLGSGHQPGITSEYLYFADSQGAATKLSVVKINKDSMTVESVSEFLDYNGADSWDGQIGNVFAFSDDVLYFGTRYGRLLKLLGGVLTTVGVEGRMLPNKFSVTQASVYYSTFSHFEVSLLPRFNVKSMGNACPTLNANLYGIRTYTTKNVPSAYPLINIIEAECARSGISVGDIDLSLLVNINVRGLRVTGGSRGALEQLQAIFPFDLSPRGYKVAFISRGGAPVATIPEADLGARPFGEKLSVLLPESREMDTQIPRAVRVKHLDPDREYDAGEQLAARPGTASRNERTVETGVVLTSAEAAQAADRLNQKDWAERVDFGPFVLPPTWGHLEPADVVTMNYRGAAFTLRLTRLDYLPDGRLESSARLTQGQSYTSTAVGVDPAVVSQAVVAIRGDTEAILLDIPRLSSSQDALGMPVAVYSLSSSWTGGAVLRSDDSGASFVRVASTDQPSAVFAALSVLESVQPYAIDNSQTLTVVPLTPGADLSAITADQLYSYGNLAAYGAPGRWEIIAFRTPVVAGANFVLSGFLRGLFGTEEFCGQHTLGDQLILLDAANQDFVSMSSDSIGAPREWAAVTFGRSLETSEAFSLVYRARALMPLAPVAPAGSRIGNDWLLRAIPRTRTPLPLFSGYEQPVGESLESYDLMIFSNSSYATIKRTFGGLSEMAATYSEADQIADFGSAQTSIYGAWYQRSSIVGRGLPGYFAITG